jgi:hypothetical protein
MASKKVAVLDLDATAKVTGSEKDKPNVKLTVAKFKIGKTQVCDILKPKLYIKCEWLTGNGSMKTKLNNT